MSTLLLWKIDCYQVLPILIGRLDDRRGFLPIQMYGTLMYRVRMSILLTEIKGVLSAIWRPILRKTFAVYVRDVLSLWLNPMWENFPCLLPEEGKGVCSVNYRSPIPKSRFLRHCTFRKVTTSFTRYRDMMRSYSKSQRYGHYIWFDLVKRFSFFVPFDPKLQTFL